MNHNEFKHDVFVYGTLKTDGPNNALIEGEFQLVTNTRTSDQYAMVKYDQYFPAVIDPEYILVDEPDNCNIFGQWMVVTDKGLEIMDMVEGHPDFFERKKVKLATGVEAYMYMVKDIPVNVEMADTTTLHVGGGRSIIVLKWDNPKKVSIY